MLIKKKDMNPPKEVKSENPVNRTVVIDQSEKRKRFIKAIDLIVETNKILKITPISDSAISKLLNPKNKMLVYNIRRRDTKVPDGIIVKLSKVFNVSIDYFYNDGFPLSYQPKDPKIAVLAESVGLGNWQEHVIINQNYTIAMNEKIERLTKVIAPENLPLFFTILNQMSEQQLRSYQELKLVLSQKEQQIRKMQEQLKEAQDNVFNAQQEVIKSKDKQHEVLLKYIDKLESLE